MSLDDELGVQQDVSGQPVRDRSGDKDFYAMAKECARLALGFDQPGDQTPKP